MLRSYSIFTQLHNSTGRESWGRIQWSGNGARFTSAADAVEALLAAHPRTYVNDLRREKDFLVESEHGPMGVAHIERVRVTYTPPVSIPSKVEVHLV